jgi:hypothetical protein
MKAKENILPSIIILVAIFLMVLFALVEGITKKPVVTEKEFPFSITYEINGETKTVEGIYACSFTGFAEPKDRMYTGVILGKENTEDVDRYIIYEDAEGVISLETRFHADYLMGDAEYDYYDESYRYEPFVLYNDHEGMESVEGMEIPNCNTKIISWEYPEPIENSFTFSHIALLSGRSVIPMTVIGMLAVLATMIFVKKEQDLVYTWMDKVSVVCNFVISLFVIPVFAFAFFLSDIVGISTDFLGQLSYCVPAIMALGVAVTITLRRKGYSKTSLFLQLPLVVLFAILFFI